MCVCVCVCVYVWSNLLYIHILTFSSDELQPCKAKVAISGRFSFEYYIDAHKVMYYCIHRNSNSTGMEGV